MTGWAFVSYISPLAEGIVVIDTHWFVMERVGETKLRQTTEFWVKISPARDHLWFDHEADPADNDKHAAGQVDLEHGPAFGKGQRIVTTPG